MNKKLVNVVDLITSVDKEIVALNYCEGHIRHHRECWNVLRKYMTEQGEIYLTPDIACQFLRDRYGIEFYSQGKISCYKMLMRRSILMLIEYQVSGRIYKRISNQLHEFPKEFEPICEAYLVHLQNINLAAGTIRGHRRTIEYFTAYLKEQKITEFGQADMSVLHDYLRELTGCSKSYVNTVSQHLKAFFRFLYENGMYPKDVSGLWPNIRVERYCNLPETFSAEETKRLLESVDRGNAIGKRDYAILLIAVRYGLRAGDIRALEFNNIDFRNQRIKLTQQKTGKPLEFVLFDDVAWALIDYRRCTWTVKGQKKIVWRCISRLDYGKKYCHASPTIEESILHQAIMTAIFNQAKQNVEVLSVLRTHIAMGLCDGESEDETLNIEFRIAEINATFRQMLKAVSVANVDDFDEARLQELMLEKQSLQQRLDRIADAQQKRKNAKSRLDEIYTIMDGLKNHPMEYDDQIVRQILECVVIDNKERIKVVFVGGLEVEEELQ